VTGELDGPRAEVLVIGAGASGACVAWSLARAGVDVLCLEQGDWLADEDLPKSHQDWAVRSRHEWNPNPALRRGPFDYPVDNRGGNPVNTYVYSAVGGSAVGWGGAFWRFSPSDFATHRTDGFGRDWPFGYEELEPYYEINEAQMGVSGAAGDPTHPCTSAPPLPPVSMGSMGHRWIAGFEELGWYWWVQHLAIASRDYRGRPACSNRGFCTAGCPTGALAVPGTTYWPEALAAGARLETRARVRRVTVDEDGRATGAEYYDAAGGLRWATADLVVIAGNGLGTPRLLLMSASPEHPGGLANSSGAVGRGLMIHPQISVVAHFEERTDADHGPWGATATTRHFYETDPANDFQRGFIITAMRGFNPLDTALQTAPWGAGHHRALEKHLNHEAVLWVCGDDAAEEHNLVRLDHENLDAWGLPGVITEYTMSENSRRMMETGLARATELARAAGADSVRSFGLESPHGWHLLGTARMGDDPRDSVVDARNRAHDVENLYIVDGSTMPAGGTVNPTNTVQAVALRAADHMIATRDRWSRSLLDRSGLSPRWRGAPGRR
jgi:choline dehydrogenase-like flavoprotein